MEVNFKDLKKLIMLCRSQGVKSIELSGIKLELGDLPSKPMSYRRMEKADQSLVNFPPNSGVDESIQIPRMDIPNDFPTEEQLLNWSSDSTEQMS